MGDTSIEWTRGRDGVPGKTWNPVRGCSRVSSGCGDSTGGGCYAERQAYRFSGPGQAYEGLVRMTAKGPRWTGKVILAQDKLEEPLRWKKPRMIFVNSMSDLFHESLSFGDIFQVLVVMQQAHWHVYQVLTKRPARMKEFFEWLAIWGEATALAMGLPEYYHWPYPNVWLGVSCEDQKTADERIPLLMETPAAVRWVSAEPLLGLIDLESVPTMEGSIDWVVIGGESGPGARPMQIEWARSLIQQCQAANVPVFMKQLGAHPYELKPAEGPQGVRAALAHIEKPHPQRTWFRDDWTLISIGETSEWVKHYKLKDKKGGDPSEWPEDLRIREYPNGSTHDPVLENSEVKPAQSGVSPLQSELLDEPLTLVRRKEIRNRLRS